MVQEFLGDFFPGTLFNRFLHIVPHLIGQKAINPHHRLVGALFFKVRLTVNSKAHQPVGVFNRNDSPGDHFPCVQFPFSQTTDIRFDCRRIPSCRGRNKPAFFRQIVTEDFWMAELWRLFRQVLP